MEKPMSSKDRPADRITVHEAAAGHPVVSHTIDSPITIEWLQDLRAVEQVATLLLQTVIVPGAQTNEGTLIEAVALPWFDIIAFLKIDPGIAFQLSWEKWEEIIAGAYKKAGFEEVTLTPRSGDLGRDVIATKRGIGSVRVIDQVKAYTPPRLVTANDVRALAGVLELDGAAKGFLSTTSDFAPKLKSDALLKKVIPSRIQLINGPELFVRLEELAGRKT